MNIAFVSFHFVYVYGRLSVCTYGCIKLKLDVSLPRMQFSYWFLFFFEEEEEEKVFQIVEHIVIIVANVYGSNSGTLLCLPLNVINGKMKIHKIGIRLLVLCTCYMWMVSTTARKAYCCDAFSARAFHDILFVRWFYTLFDHTSFKRSNFHHPIRATILYPFNYRLEAAWIIFHNNTLCAMSKNVGEDKGVGSLFRLVKIR